MRAPPAKALPTCPGPAASLLLPVRAGPLEGEGGDEVEDGPSSSFGRVDAAEADARRRERPADDIGEENESAEIFSCGSKPQVKYALAYSAVEDAKQEDGIPTRSSAKIDGSQREVQYLRCGFAAWVGNPCTHSKTWIVVYAERLRREYADAVVPREREEGYCGT
ncbi:hypothetical protein B0H16DRAFT_1469568 [Mycena metata]|uniref:Uncharacterized protein n=1 Tax=Mycena metata TaxID=1033252 RepID=A0AAD7HXC8_9AGAR|nr:hypothetical protein B0H16DRAFT_1469568 [Mycena metata]